MCQVQSLATILPTTESTDSCDNWVKPTDTTDTGNTTNNVYRRDWQADELYGQLGDLVNARFRAWYCNHFYRLGKDRVLTLAAVARADGRDPARYFSKLLKAAE